MSLVLLALFAGIAGGIFLVGRDEYKDVLLLGATFTIVTTNLLLLIALDPTGIATPFAEIILALSSFVGGLVVPTGLTVLWETIKDRK